MPMKTNAVSLLYNTQNQLCCNPRIREPESIKSDKIKNTTTFVHRECQNPPKVEVLVVPLSYATSVFISTQTTIFKYYFCLNTAWTLIAHVAGHLEENAQKLTKYNFFGRTVSYCYCAGGTLAPPISVRMMLSVEALCKYRYI